MNDEASKGEAFAELKQDQAVNSSDDFSETGDDASAEISVPSVTEPVSVTAKVETETAEPTELAETPNSELSYDGDDENWKQFIRRELNKKQIDPSSWQEASDEDAGPAAALFQGRQAEESPVNAGPSTDDLFAGLITKLISKAGSLLTSKAVPEEENSENAASERVMAVSEGESTISEGERAAKEGEKRKSSRKRRSAPPVSSIGEAFSGNIVAANPASLPAPVLPLAGTQQSAAVPVPTSDPAPVTEQSPAIEPASHAPAAPVFVPAPNRRKRRPLGRIGRRKRRPLGRIGRRKFIGRRRRTAKRPNLRNARRRVKARVRKPVRRRARTPGRLLRTRPFVKQSAAKAGKRRRPSA